ncbi:MAG: hypothetical protein WCW66_03985 [Patescibacteria group bacterium]
MVCGFFAIASFLGLRRGVDGTVGPCQADHDREPPQDDEKDDLHRAVENEQADCENQPDEKDE